MRTFWAIERNVVFCSRVQRGFKWLARDSECSHSLFGGWVLQKRFGVDLRGQLQEWEGPVTQDNISPLLKRQL